LRPQNEKPHRDNEGFSAKLLSNFVQRHATFSGEVTTFMLHSLWNSGFREPRQGVKIGFPRLSLVNAACRIPNVATSE
jgi:hypothetical protein